MRQWIFVIMLIIGPLCAARADGLADARAAQEAEGRRDFELAVTLYTKAIDSGDLSKQNLADAYHYRGNSKFFLRRFSDAAQDYELSLKSNRYSVYAALWLYLARARAGQDAKAGLTRNVDGLDLFYWPGPIVLLFRGEATPKEVLEAAADPFLGRKGQSEQLCEGYFYVGQYYLLKGKRDEAFRLFREAIETGATDFVEYDAAKVELEMAGS